jgi:nicotinamide phosphoribosyltransferase
MCIVYRDGDDILYTDGHTIEEADNAENNLLKTVFKDGKLLTNYSLKEIRDRLHSGKF